MFVNVHFLGHGLIKKLSVGCSAHVSNSGLIACYSVANFPNYDLNNEPKVRYSSNVLNNRPFNSHTNDHNVNTVEI